MIMMNRFLLLILFSAATLAATAQDESRRERLLQETRGITYDKEWGVDLKLMTDGWAIGGHWGTLKNYYTTNIYTVEFGELKHVREARQRAEIGAFGRAARSFIYGKQNNLFALRAGMGQKRYFTEKARRNGVAVGMFYNFGGSLGIIKPYYVDIARQEPGSNRILTDPTRYTEATATQFLNINRIYGASSLAMGLNEISLAPGAHAKVALHLDWGAYDENVKALEVGIAADFYFRQIDLMVTNDNKPFFINLYAAIQLGKRQ